MNADRSQGESKASNAASAPIDLSVVSKGWNEWCCMAPFTAGEKEGKKAIGSTWHLFPMDPHAL